MVIELVYNFLIRLYGWVVKLTSCFDHKAELWIKGRNDLFQRLSSENFKGADWIWIHCASLGEFEQGRTLIENLNIQSDYKILLTFFSPSGYEKRRNYPKADYICYLPLDTRKNAKLFIGIIQPKVAVFIRYEFWYHHLNTLYNKGIPVFLISASFRKKQLFFKPIMGTWFRRMLSYYEMIFTIDEESIELLKDYDVNNCKRVGDTRADRVSIIAKESQSFSRIETFRTDRKLVICGSVWGEDIEVLLEVIKESVKDDVCWVLAPHEVGDRDIQELETGLAKEQNIVFSKYSESDSGEANVLIIDNIGILSRIYKYADLTYVGGGFGKGIHNVLEPAVFGNPVFIGPKYHKFPEAKGLIKAGGAISISNSKEGSENILYYLSHPEKRLLMGECASQYINSISGATDAIVKEILLTDLTQVS